MNIFEQAVRQQIRLDVAGSISIEQLYTAKPTKSFISTLEDYEETLLEDLSKLESPTRRRSFQKSELRKKLELILAIVSGYLDEQEEAQRQARDEKQIKEREQELLQLLAEKQRESLRSMSVAEIEEQLKSLRT